MVLKGTRIGTYIWAIFVSIWILIPIYWLLNSSLQTENQLHTTPPAYFPPTPSVGLGNYWFIFHVQEVMQERLKAGVSFFLPAVVGQLPQAIVHSMIIALAITATNIVLGLHVAYTFSRVKFRGSFKLFILTICTRLLPEVAVIIPFYLIIRNLNLLDTLVAVYLIHITFTLPFSIWILHNYLSFIPEDIEDSARVDRYSRFEVLYKVLLPIIKPGIVAIGIMSFMLSYREFFFALILTQTVNSRTVPVVIASMAANPVVPVSLLAAAGIVTSIPPIIVIIVFRKYIVRGLVAGAIR
jgi:multiple sugar transport system permease protein